MKDSTIKYYDDNHQAFADRTSTLDETTPFYKEVLAFLKPGDKILDYGCGTGRDNIYFTSLGFDVTSTDGSTKMCEIASNSCKNVRQETFEELNEKDNYNLVWAFASILHVSTSDLPNIFKKVATALTDKGIFFISFKYGKYEGIRNGRFFNDFTEEKFLNLIKFNSDFDLIKMWVTNDVRLKQNRDGKWLNIILQKTK